MLFKTFACDLLINTLLLFAPAMSPQAGILNVCPQLMALFEEAV